MIMDETIEVDTSYESGRQNPIESMTFEKSE